MDGDDKALRQAERTREADERLDDHNAELSGTKSGFSYRTSAAAASDSRSDIRAKKARKADSIISALQALLDSDPEYAALYRDTVSRVSDAAAKIERMIEQLEGAVEDAQNQLDDTIDAAAKLHPTGEAVFRDANGNVVAADGRVLTDEEAQSVVWPDNAPSYEQYLAQKRAVEEARQRLRDAQEYQAWLADVQNRLGDPDNPLSLDELQAIQDQIEAKAGLERAVERPASVAHDDTPEPMMVEKPQL